MRSSTLEVEVGDNFIIPQVTRFKYLWSIVQRIKYCASIVQNDGEMVAYVNHRIQTGWLKWRMAHVFYVIRKYRLS